jgi:hypothetical protein
MQLKIISPLEIISMFQTPASLCCTHGLLLHHGAELSHFWKPCSNKYLTINKTIGYTTLGVSIGGGNNMQG